MSYKVSVIIPLYNGSNFIRETLESCRKQTYNNIEVILVDDYSSDDGFSIAKNLIDSYGKQSKFQYIQNSSNLGINASCNRAALVAKGDCLLFLGQDDILPTDHISRMIAEFQNDLSFIYSSPDVIDESGNIIRMHNENDERKDLSQHQLKFGMTKENMISSPGLIMNAEKYRIVGGYSTKYKNYGEWNMWIRLLQQGNAKFCTTTHAQYRRHSSNITNTFSHKDKQKELVSYWNECRCLAMKSFDLSIIERLEARWYYFCVNHKTVIRVKNRIQNVKAHIHRFIIRGSIK